MNGIDNEMGSVEIWIPKSSYLKLGLVITMASYMYRFSWYAYLSSFSPYFVSFGHELEPPTSIQRDVIVVINLDGLNLWI